VSESPHSTPQEAATVSLADEEGVKRILIDTLFGLWATVNNLSRLRPSRRDRYRVTVFGSARTTTVAFCASGESALRRPDEPAARATRQ
jgi:hypothetical protein